MRRLITVALAALLSAPALAGPPPGDRPPHGHHGPGGPGVGIAQHAERLGLDEATLAQIEEIGEASRVAGEALGEAMHEARDELHELLRADDPERRAVLKAAERIGDAETALRKHHLGTMLDIRALLTPEQREELVRIHEEIGPPPGHGPPHRGPHEHHPGDR